MPRKMKSAAALYTETKALLDAAIAVGEFVSARQLLKNLELCAALVKEGK